MKEKIEDRGDRYKITDPHFTLEKDVILSKSTESNLHESITKLKFHKKIYEEWNFGSVDPQGRSIIINLYGPPGTGKTMIAEAFAGSLKRKIIKLGIAEVESKFMGETAKNIQDIFAFAHENQAVLFFDEADTLLGKRLSSVTQGVDNEVNAMRSTLLIELEKFDGITIFATNFVKNYDAAFLSRISHQIHVELPDQEARIKLWSRMFLDEIPMLEDKKEIAASCAEISEGMSGRDIRTCMRLALPKAFMDLHCNDKKPVLKKEHLIIAIEQVQTAKKDTGDIKPNISSDEIQSSKKILGIK